jgi:hypothetical protein
VLLLAEDASLDVIERGVCWRPQNVWRTPCGRHDRGVVHHASLRSPTRLPARCWTSCARLRVPTRHGSRRSALREPTRWILEILRPYRHLRAPEPNEDWMLGAHRWENGEYEVHAALMERGARGDAVLTVIVGADGARLEDAHT